MALGKSILEQEREFNKQAGFTQAHDRLPLYFIREKLPPHNVNFDVTDEELDSLYTW